MDANKGAGTLAGKTAVVTGASSGIGREIARGLAEAGATVVLACRDRGRAQAAEDWIRAGLPGARLESETLDLADLASVRAAAGAILGRHPRLDVLVNNAGAWTPERRESPDGLELTWAGNVVGPHLLTSLLLPGLKAAGGARVVNLSSTVAGGLDLEDPEYKRRPYKGLAAYSQSKQANRMLTWTLAEELAGSGVTANALSPGLVKTGLNRNAAGAVRLAFGLLLPLMGKTPAQGADTAVWLASDASVEGVTGKFWEKRKELACRFRDPAARSALKALCDRAAGLA